MSTRDRGDGGDGGGGRGDGPDGGVGSIGEEAAKLLHAFQEWAAHGGGEAAEATTSAAADAASTWQRLNEHVATGGADCRYCPVCQVISTVRQTSPEVRAHLTSAASSLLQAAAGLLATQVPEDGRGRGSADGVEKIDLDPGDGSDWEED